MEFKSYILFSLLILSLFPIGYTNANVDLQKQESSITYAIPYQFSEFSYFSAGGYASKQWISAISAGLYHRSVDSNYDYKPDLAASPPTISDDGLKVIVKLSENLYFSNNDPLTADDVKFTYEVALTPQINRDRYDLYRQYFDSNASISILDTHTIKFELSKVYAFFYEALTLPIIPKERFQTKYEKCVVGLLDHCSWNAEDGSDAIYAGPYKIEDIDTTNNIVSVVKNERWYDADEIMTNKIVFKFIEETPSAASALNKGDIDILDSDYIYSPMYDTHPNTTRIVVDDLAYQEIALNHNNPYYGNGSKIPDNDTTDNFSDARLVRQAISRIINRKSIIENYTHQLGIPATSPIPYGSLGYNKEIKAHEYNIKEARKLMEIAGFNYNNTDIDLSSSTSECSSDCFFNITIISPNSATTTLAQIVNIENYLIRIGIGVKSHEYVGWDSIIPRTFGSEVNPPGFDEGGFDMLFVGYSEKLEWQPGDRYTESGLCSTGTCDNFYNYRNQTLEDKINQYQTEYDLSKRTDLLQQIQSIFEYELPVISLFYPQSLLWINKDISGIDPLLFQTTQLEWENVEKNETLINQKDEDAFFTIPLNSSMVLFGLILLYTSTKILRRRS